VFKFVLLIWVVSQNQADVIQADVPMFDTRTACESAAPSVMKAYKAKGVRVDFSCSKVEVVK